MSESRNDNGSPWRFRRRLAISVLLFCAGCSIYAISRGPEMAQAVLGAMSVPTMTVLGSYFVAATYEDTRRGGGNGPSA